MWCSRLAPPSHRGHLAPFIHGQGDKGVRERVQGDNKYKGQGDKGTRGQGGKKVTPWTNYTIVDLTKDVISCLVDVTRLLISRKPSCGQPATGIRAVGRVRGAVDVEQSAGG